MNIFGKISGNPNLPTSNTTNAGGCCVPNNKEYRYCTRYRFSYACMLVPQAKSLSYEVYSFPLTATGVSSRIINSSTAVQSMV